MVATKGPLKRSEYWLSLIAAIQSVLLAQLDGHPSVVAWVSFGGVFALAGVHAVFRTPLVAKDAPGVRTARFWVSLATVLGSGAAAVAAGNIPGIPPVVIQVASIVSGLVAAAGYGIHRYARKVA